MRAEVIERAALRNRDIAALIAVSELFLDRLHTIIAVPATLLRKRFVEVIVQYFPAAGAALPVEHHLLEFLVFLLTGTQCRNPKHIAHDALESLCVRQNTFFFLIVMIQTSIFTVTQSSE